MLKQYSGGCSIHFLNLSRFWQVARATSLIATGKISWSGETFFISVTSFNRRAIAPLISQARLAGTRTSSTWAKGLACCCRRWLFTIRTGCIDCQTLLARLTVLIIFWVTSYAARRRFFCDYSSTTNTLTTWQVTCSLRWTLNWTRASATVHITLFRLPPINNIGLSSKIDLAFQAWFFFRCVVGFDLINLLLFLVCKLFELLADFL